MKTIKMYDQVRLLRDHSITDTNNVFICIPKGEKGTVIEYYEDIKSVLVEFDCKKYKDNFLQVISIYDLDNEL